MSGYWDQFLVSFTLVSCLHSYKMALLPLVMIRRTWLFVKTITKDRDYSKQLLTGCNTGYRIKMSETKLVHIDFSNRPIEHQPVYINDQIIPYTANYLNAKLRWKQKQNDFKLKHIKKNSILGRFSTLSVRNKLINKSSNHSEFMVYNFEILPGNVIGILFHAVKFKCSLEPLFMSYKI